MLYLIYKITNRINGRFYIGAHQTSNPNDGYMGSGVAIKRAIQKYGIENFNKEILFECQSVEDMYRLEKELVTPFTDNEKSYNVMEGGKGGWNHVNSSGKNGTHLAAKKRALLLEDEEWCQNWKEKTKVGAIKYSNTVTPEEYTKRGIKANETALRNNGVYGFEGKTHREDSKKSIGSQNSVHQTGEGNSQYGTVWITDGTINKKIKKDSVIPDGWYRGRKTK